MTSTAAVEASARRSPLILLGGLLGVIVVALLVFQPPTYMRGVVGDPENPEPEGTMAVAEILRDHGSEVRVVRSVSTALATETDLLVVSDPHVLTPHQLRALAEKSVDAVFINASRPLPGFLDSPTRVGDRPTGALSPGCEDERAQAGPIRTSGPVLSAPGATACFPGPDEGAMLTWETGRGTRATILPRDVLTNSSLLEESNAALSIRVLGQSPRVTWLVGSRTDPYGTSESAQDFSLTWLWAAIASIFIAAIWWRGPRFGKLTSEPLPVIVNASETTIGRGHLYRRSGDLHHAAVSLRLGALNRIGPRIGLAPDASPEEVVSKVSEARRNPGADVEMLLYGAAPDSAQSLHALALALDALVDEVEQV